MDERKKQILHALIRDYVDVGEPVGSRTIAKKYGLGVSPATIRNEMSDLEWALLSSHTPRLGECPQTRAIATMLII